MNPQTTTDRTLARYRKFGWEYHRTQGAGSQYGDLEWFGRVALSNDGPILDLGCGSGRVLLPLRSAGHSVVGLDGSAQLLELCGRQAADENPSCATPLARVQAEFNRLCFRRHSFGLAIVAGNTLPALAEDLRRKLFTELKGILRPGGVLAANVRRFNPARFEAGLPVVHSQEPLYDEVTGAWVTRSTELVYEEEDNRIVAHFTFRCEFPEGRVEESKYEIAYAADGADRIVDEAQAAGFVLEAAHEGYGQPDCSGPAREMVGLIFRTQAAS